MPGSVQGGYKAAASNKVRHGEDFYKKIGKMGGSVGGVKGFAAMGREFASAAGKMGGSASRRGK